jgi:hypothetical protein
MTDSDAEKPWKDITHKGNKIRPRVRCVGCGKLGSVTYWGPWCFKCNVERMERINAQFDKVRKIFHD